ncbi:MAG: J domain-containing protein [Verrucomicrobia bacterium]|nr:MAG: J domain-containing protein [Verrucomicrobiota bacterium]
MSVQFKDYYQTLGVSKDASSDAIKKAFRDLARRTHPDKIQGAGKAEAEVKFKEINEAYEVLRDPDKRRKYDTLGADWDRPQGGGFRRSRAGSRTGGFGVPGEEGYEFHFGGTGFSDFFEQFFGMGADPRERGPRFRAHRSGPSAQRIRGSDVEAEILVTLEEALNGSNRQISLRKIDSTTGAEQTQRFQVKIPKGVRESQRIRLAGQGEAGIGGGGSGDLFLKVRYAQHPFFTVDGDRLIYDLDLAPWEAVLGTVVTLETLEGHVNLKIKPGSQAGTQLRLPGHGMPKPDGSRGDLRVALHIQVPSSVSDKERDRWEELAKLSSFEPRGS